MAVGNLAFPTDVTTVSGLIVGSGVGVGAGVGFATLVCDGTSVVFGAGAPPVQASPMTPEVNNINTKDRSRMCPTADFILLFYQSWGTTLSYDRAVPEVPSDQKSTGGVGINSHSL